jgi:OmcA/MtrC family decaheme c-type cytochrome
MGDSNDRLLQPSNAAPAADPFRSVFMRSRQSLFVAALVLAIPLSAQKTGTAQKPRLSSLDQNAMSFIRPGITVKVVSAAVAKDGTITARVKIADPKGAPLDMNGVTTPGAVTLRFIAAYIPAGQKEYTAYTTTVAKATINSNPSQTQAGTDSGGVFTTNAEGDYTYTFKTKAPAGFDPTVTHSIGVTAQRDLSEFMTYAEWAETANDVYNFVPDGSAVKVTRQVVPTAACNQCHDPLIGHGGSRLTVEMCILCHSPQTINPDTQLTQDMPVLIHKIHMGKNLPSVKAGTPYRIYHRGAWSDFSDVGFPGGTDELMTCTVCHQNAPQASNAMTSPTRAACGACHDNVNFATGANHVNLPQLSDRDCTQCHAASSGNEFDASVKGAHTVGTRSQQLGGVNFTIIGVDNAKPGQKPAVTFIVRDKAGSLLDISKMSSLNLVMAGPTTDYNGYVSEDARKAPIVGGQYVYTFTAPLPDKASGTFAVGIEGYFNATINPNTVLSATVRDLGYNKVFYFGIGGAKATPRRQVVSQAKCLTCHNTLMLHGGNRQSVEYCVVCHNPGVTDSAQRKGDTPESINLKTLIHKIHTGKDLTTDFTVMGHNFSVNNYNDVGYVGDRTDCEQCHLPGTYTVPLPEGTISQVAPRDYLNPLPPTAGACLSCHTTKAAAAHAAVNISPTLGEACAACHGPNSEASVSKAHAR